MIKACGPEIIGPVKLRQGSQIGLVQENSRVGCLNC